MPRCPKCGHDEVPDWSRVVGVFAVSLLYLIYLVTADSTPRSWRFVALSAYLVFTLGTIWYGIKQKRIRDEHLKLHPTLRAS